MFDVIICYVKLDVQAVLNKLFNSPEWSRSKIRNFNQQFSVLEHLGKVSIKGRFDIKIAENSLKALKLWKNGESGTKQSGSYLNKAKYTARSKPSRWTKAVLKCKNWVFLYSSDTQFENSCVMIRV